MRLPLIGSYKLQIGHTVWSVSFRTDPHVDGEDVRGWCDDQRMEIVVVKNATAFERAHTLVHEILHAVEYVYGFDIYHPMIDQLSGYFISCVCDVNDKQVAANTKRLWSDGAKFGLHLATFALEDLGDKLSARERGSSHARICKSIKGHALELEVMTSFIDLFLWSHHYHSDPVAMLNMTQQRCIANALLSMQVVASLPSRR